MIYLYHLLTTLVSPIVVLLFPAYALFRMNKRKGIGHHFGRVPVAPEPEKKTLWIHALSVGEAVAAAPFLRRVREQRPGLRLVVSVTTDAGYTTALAKLDFVDRIFFHPLDCLPFSLAAIRRIRPDLFVLTDTGFWPGLLDLLTRRGTAVFVYNGRISERSLSRYLKIRSFMAPLFNRLTAICMQNETGRNALLQLGVEENRIRVLGDPKFDALEPLPEKERLRLRDIFKIHPEYLVWVAGSTHAGEEEIVLTVYEKMKKKFPTLVLLLAPRRMERVDEVADLLRQHNLPFLLRSEFKRTGPRPQDVVLIDSIGELAKLYAIAHVAFVGNSLVRPGGGHSLIEPAVQGVPVLHGPYIENVADTAQLLGKNRLAIRVKDAAEMEEFLGVLLQNFGQLAKNAPSILKEFKGASHKMADQVLAELDRNGAENKSGS